MKNLEVSEYWSMFVIKPNLLHCSIHFALLFLYVVIILTRQIKCKSGCSREVVTEAHNFAKALQRMETYDCLLYTPTLADYENCSKSALTCFELEVKVLMVEVQSVTKFKQLPRLLKNLSKKLQDERRPCPVCELYQEESPETFLKTLLHVLQKMNAKNC